MTDEKRERDERETGIDQNRALTEWTSEDELEREDERIGDDDVPKLANPPG